MKVKLYEKAVSEGRRSGCMRRQWEKVSGQRSVGEGQAI